MNEFDFLKSIFCQVARKVLKTSSNIRISCVLSCLCTRTASGLNLWCVHLCSVIYRSP